MFIRVRNHCELPCPFNNWHAICGWTNSHRQTKNNTTQCHTLCYCFYGWINGICFILACVSIYLLFTIRLYCKCVVPGFNYVPQKMFWNIMILLCFLFLFFFYFLLSTFFVCECSHLTTQYNFTFTLNTSTTDKQIPKVKTKQHSVILNVIVLMYELMIFALYCLAFGFIFYLLFDCNTSVLFLALIMLPKRSLGT